MKSTLLAGDGLRGAHRRHETPEPGEDGDGDAGGDEVGDEEEGEDVHVLEGKSQGGALDEERGEAGDVEGMLAEGLPRDLLQLERDHGRHGVLDRVGGRAHQRHHHDDQDALPALAQRGHQVEEGQVRGLRGVGTKARHV